MVETASALSRNPETHIALTKATALACQKVAKHCQLKIDFNAITIKIGIIIIKKKSMYTIEVECSAL